MTRQEASLKELTDRPRLKNGRLGRIGRPEPSRRLPRLAAAGAACLLMIR